MAIWRYTDAPPDLSGYATATDLDGYATVTDLDDLDKSTTATAAQWLAYIAAQNAEQSGGTSFSRTFQGTGALPATMYQDGRMGVGMRDSAIQATYGFVANNTYSFWCLDGTPLETDDFSVTLTLRGNTTNNAPTYILARSNNDVTESVCCRITQTGIAVGKVAWVAGVPQFDGWNSTGYASSAGATIEFRGSGNNYTVIVNGSVKLTFTYTGTPYPINSLHRFVGTAFTQANGLFFGTNTAPVTSLTAADIAVPNTVGTGWELYRAGTSGVAKASGNSTVASCFDVLNRAANVDVVTLGEGRIRIKKPGWYTLTWRYQMSTSAGTGLYTGVLWGDMAGGSTLAALRSGQDVSGSAIFNAHAALEYYLPAGAIIAPGLVTNAAKSVVGDPNGYSTYWTGALTRSV